MTQDIPALIAEAREEAPFTAWAQDADLLTRLVDALEATVKEMHARELHHFEEEKLRAEAEALIDRMTGSEKFFSRLTEAEAERDRYRDAITEELSRHTEKRGESPRYAPDDHQAEREPIHWEPYVICNACGTDYPCRTRRTLTRALNEKEDS